MGSLASSQSVSFRQGTNVEFGSSFGGSAGSVEPMDSAFNLDQIAAKARDFSNPMYDAVQNSGDPTVGNGSSGKVSG